MITCVICKQEIKDDAKKIIDKFVKECLK